MYTAVQYMQITMMAFLSKSTDYLECSAKMLDHIWFHS